MMENLLAYALMAAIIIPLISLIIGVPMYIIVSIYNNHKQYQQTKQEVMLRIEAKHLAQAAKKQGESSPEYQRIHTAYKAYTGNPSNPQFNQRKWHTQHAVFEGIDLTALIAFEIYNYAASANDTNNNNVNGGDGPEGSFSGDSSGDSGGDGGSSCSSSCGSSCGGGCGGGD